MAVDILCAPGAVRINEPSPFIEAGKLSTANIKNVMRITQYPFDSTDGAQTTLDVYTRTTPVGDATLAVLPIGSRCEMFTFSPAGTRTAYALYVKVATGSTGWAKVSAAITAATDVVIAAGKQVSVGGSTTELISITGLVSTDVVFVNICSVGTVGGSLLGYNNNTAGVITCLLSADQKVSAQLAYMVVRKVTA